jgi:hypothetical protein
MSRRALPSSASAAAIAASLLASSAGAQVPAPPVPAPPAPAPPSASGKATLEVHGGMATRKQRFFTRGQRVKVSGSVRPFVAGQKVTLHVIRRGKTIKRYDAPVRRRGSRGR